MGDVPESMERKVSKRSEIQDQMGRHSWAGSPKRNDFGGDDYTVRGLGPVSEGRVLRVAREDEGWYLYLFTANFVTLSNAEVRGDVSAKCIATMADALVRGTA